MVCTGEQPERAKAIADAHAKLESVLARLPTDPDAACQSIDRDPRSAWEYARIVVEASGVDVDLDVIRQSVSSSSSSTRSGSHRPATTGMSEAAGELLVGWIAVHAVRPYPSRVVKHMLAVVTGCTVKQVDMWFRNRRRSLLRRA